MQTEFKNPETIIALKQRPSIDGLAREYSAKAALRSMYEQRALALGMSYACYCQRFNVRV